MSWLNKLLNNNPLRIVFKQGLSANINTDVTKARAITGEPHYCTDTGDLFIFNGTDNSLVGGRAQTDTRSNILATTPAAGSVAYATDFNLFYLYNSGWYEAAIPMAIRSAMPNMGSESDEGVTGYTADYITDKDIVNCKIGDGSSNENRALRITNAASLNSDVYQVNINGGWQTILSGINIQTDDSENPADVEFTSFADWNISLISGNSDRLDPNGQPLITNLSRDIGAHQSKALISGGTF